MNPQTFFEPGPLRVKICGITNSDDAAMAVSAGADALGINLFPGSKRFIALADAQLWLRELPVTRVAVVVNASADEITRIADSAVFDAIQFHGDELPAFCAASPLPWTRAVRVAGPEALAASLEYRTPSILLDGFARSGYGGTGATVDLALAAEFVRARADRRVILAGGLRADTVAEAVRTVRPQAVDVASGVEIEGEPRRKDAGRVRAFIAAARGA